MRIKDADYLTREEALAQLGIKPSTLYSYASRGQVRRMTAPDGRQSLYARADIERLSGRQRGAVSRTGAAATSMRWGEPVISSAITRIDAAGPVYRNRPVLELARSGVEFESVVHLLLTGVWQPASGAWPVIATPLTALRRMPDGQAIVDSADLGKVLASAVLALGMEGRGGEELTGASTVASTRLILQTLAGCIGCLSERRKFVQRQDGETIADMVLRASGAGADRKLVAARSSAVNGLLVMLADHELAAASFAARISASTQSDMYNCIAAAICTHTGFSAGTATDLVQKQLYDVLNAHNTEALMFLVKERGESIFGFNHHLYAQGDPRADYILSLINDLKPEDAKLKRFLRFLALARTDVGAHPGLAVALVAFTHAIGAPALCASALWILSRTAGWAAHVIEQRTQAFMLRPRANYESGAEAA